MQYHVYYAINIQNYEYLLSYIEDRKILVLGYIFATIGKQLVILVQSSSIFYIHLINAKIIVIILLTI